MIVAWRLVKARWKSQAFTGVGASLEGGRWNQPGTRAVYVSDSLALAILEQLVHLAPEDSGLSFVSFRVEIPDSVHIDLLAPRDLPPDWREEPVPASTMNLGTDWVKKRSGLALKVPSVIVPSEFDYMLNPLHSDFSRLNISNPEHFSFDPRLSKASP